jgi:hypothetical protein
MPRPACGRMPTAVAQRSMIGRSRGRPPTSGIAAGFVRILPQVSPRHSALVRGTVRSGTATCIASLTHPGPRQASAAAPSRSRRRKGAKRSAAPCQRVRPGLRCSAAGPGIEDENAAHVCAVPQGVPRLMPDKGPINTYSGITALTPLPRRARLSPLPAGARPLRRAASGSSRQAASCRGVRLRRRPCGWSLPGPG